MSDYPMLISNKLHSFRNFNKQKYNFNFALNQLGIQGKVKIRDLWRQKNLGIFSGSYETSIPYHGVSLIKITPIK